ncbi:hypothetical protein B0H16DRAFT_1484477 [Mycena metata]|uniref:F-box domain-containing protein n=1 Tax=Mycena metata TaxID=1033252 RepID=A0AAD7GP62_9AGAR|nr:hypothetical protein B0H16DRAFT_1484477 [Mycena metata]
MVSPQLPPEMHGEILSHTGRHDLTVYCRASKAFYELSVVVLYARIVVETQAQIDHLLQVLDQQPRLATLLRSLTFHAFLGLPLSFPVDVNNLFRLTELNISCLGMQVLDWAMENATLPCLKVFCARTMGRIHPDTLAGFLNRHPHITTLTVESGLPFTLNTILMLPALEDITAPPEVIASLSCRTLRFATVIWLDRDKDFVEILTRLALLSSARLLALSLTVHAPWPPDVILAVAGVLPYIESLALKSSGTEAFLRVDPINRVKIGEAVAQLTSLTHLEFSEYALVSRFYDGYNPTRWRPGWRLGQTLVEHWSSKCPTLTCIGLYGEIWEHEGTWTITSTRNRPTAVEIKFIPLTITGEVELI